MSEQKWILYPPLQEEMYSVGDHVFIKNKSKKEIGRRGLVTGLQSPVQNVGEGKGKGKVKARSRVMVKIPIYRRKRKADEKLLTLSENDNNDNGEGEGKGKGDGGSFYIASFRPNCLVPVIGRDDSNSRSSDGKGITNTTIMVTRTTDKYRLLAASQLEPTDHVLEIGCSNGECSLIIAKYVTQGSLVGIDTSKEMISQAKSKFSGQVKDDDGDDCDGDDDDDDDDDDDLPPKTTAMITASNVDFHVVDPFGDPRRALALAQKGGNGKKDTPNIPSVVFIDIGGNRDLISVVKMLSWVMKSFNPRMCIIKSEEMVDKMKMDASISKTMMRTKDSREHDHKRQKLIKTESANTSHLVIRNDGTLEDGHSWFSATMEEIKNDQAKGCSTRKPLFCHPKKAPLSLSPVDNTTPICRYYNYDPTGCRKGPECPLDHIHCHWCLKPGHRALDCPTIESR